MLKIDTSSHDGTRKLRNAAASVAALSLACAIVTVYGVMVRTGSGISDFMPRFTSEKFVAIPKGHGLNVALESELLLLRRRLELLGATDDEISEYLQRFTVGLHAYALQGERLRNELGDLAAFVEKAEKVKYDDRDSPSVVTTVELNRIKRLLDQWIEHSRAGFDVTASVVESVRSDLEDKVGDPIDRKDTVEADKALDGVQMRLEVLRDGLRYRQEITDMIENIDRVIELQSAPTDSRIEQPRLTRRPSVKY